MTHPHDKAVTFLTPAVVTARGHNSVSGSWDHQPSHVAVFSILAQLSVILLGCSCLVSPVLGTHVATHSPGMHLPTPITLSLLFVKVSGQQEEMDGCSC